LERKKHGSEGKKMVWSGKKWFGREKNGLKHKKMVRKDKK
jgi:hypothetical protein